jgi:hypothetical protein
MQDLVWVVSSCHGPYYSPHRLPYSADAAGVLESEKVLLHAVSAPIELDRKLGGGSWGKGYKGENVLLVRS